MANEISLSVMLDYAKGQRNFSTTGKGFTGILRDVTGGDVTFRTHVVGTSAEALTLGEVGTPGFIVVKNIEGTNTSNYVCLGASTVTSSNGLVKLKNGDVAMFRLGISAPYAISDGNSCEIIYAIIED